MRSVKRKRPGVDVELDFWTRLGNYLAQFTAPPPAHSGTVLIRAAIYERCMVQKRAAEKLAAERTIAIPPPVLTVPPKRPRRFRVSHPKSRGRGTPPRARP